ncbi:MAG: hypothetical protein WCJ07_01200 [Verrucomicrobiota bacterium]
MRAVLVILAMAFAVSGCTTKSTVRLKEQNAFLAGQNVALRQQAQSASAFPAVSVIGPVEKASVPWVAGLTLTQAIATAKYLDPNEPQEIILTRQGESAKLNPAVLLNGAVIPLEAGDVVEIR